MKLLIALALFLAAPAAAETLSGSEQQRVARATADLIERRYVDPRRGQEIAKALRAEKWPNSSDAHDFAKRLTNWLRTRSGDGHFAVEYSARPISEGSGEAAFSQAETQRYYGAHLNHGVERIERLENNIMVLDLRVFPPPEMAGDVISAAMTLVAQGDALIIDLRKNGGGMDTANLLMSYLLPPGTEVSGSYDRPSGKRTYATTSSWLPGRRFGTEKPVYILTSKRTFSAAEAVAYDLQAAKRALIIGEVTGGGANPFEYRRIDAHFALSLPEARSINPITGTNWQDVGVKPDIAVPANQALDRALELARAAIKGRSAGGSDPRSLP